jgi:mRNA interferase HigB
MAQTSQWESFTDIRSTLNTADHVGNRVIFNIRGGYYRLVTWVDYDRQLVVMKWFGTHGEYDRDTWQ